jgi:hypothetical protein
MTTERDPSESRQQMIARRAYELWEQRGRPFGSPEVDWQRAIGELQDRIAEEDFAAPPFSAFSMEPDET